MQLIQCMLTLLKNKIDPSPECQRLVSSCVVTVLSFFTRLSPLFDCVFEQKMESR